MARYRRFKSGGPHNWVTDLRFTLIEQGKSKLSEFTAVDALTF